MKLLFRLLSLFLVFVSTLSHASSFRPIIVNFTPEEYGMEAGLQNWDVSQDDQGFLYFANQRGLLVYDGAYWKLVQLPSHALIRSVEAVGDRIYVGSYEELGYFTYDSFGRLQYTSIRPLIAGFPMKNEEPWNILCQGKDIYFQTFSSVFHYQPEANGGKGAITPVHINGKSPLYLHKLGDELWAQLIDGGYCRFVRNQYKEVIRRSDLGNDNAVAAFAWGKQAILLATESHGLKVYNKRTSSVQPFETQIDGQLRRASINRMVITHDSTLVVGTLLDGIFGMDKKGRLLWHYNLADGLVNNSVLRLICDANNNVWACLDGGIAFVRQGLPFTFLKPSAKESPLGTVYGLLVENQQLFIASNQGLYRYPLGSNASPQLVSGTEGQNWHITAVGHQIFAGSNRTTYRVHTDGGFSIEPVPNTTSSSTCIRECRIYGQDVLVESSYSNLRIYTKKNGNFELSHQVEGFVSPIRHLEVDEKGCIWAANMQKGIFCLTLSRDLKRVQRQKYYESLDEDAQPSICYVLKIYGRIVLSDSRRLFVYDEDSQQIKPFERLNSILPDTEEIYSSSEAGSRGYWLAGKTGYALVENVGDSLAIREYLPVSMMGMQVGESASRVYQSGDEAFFNFSGSIVCYDMQRVREKSRIQPKLSLREASFHSSDGEEHFLELSRFFTGRPKVKSSVHLLFSYPSFNSDCGSYKFILSGAVNRTLTSTTPLLELSNLSVGKYKLTVEAISSSGKVLDSITLQFRVPAPWYLAWWAFLIYFAIIGFCAWHYGRWQTRRALRIKEKQHETESREQHIKMLEQERTIAEQQRQILETELSSKSKDLASLAMDVFSKEKVLENLRESMHEERQKGNISQREMTALLQRIQQTEGNLEFWNIYQKNFDLIHEHFFRNLQERYPSLTSNDLKFCALLRLNLSTKDIAKFTNLSVRGVESARLRLRKKFGLSPEQNLIDFLISVK